MRKDRKDDEYHPDMPPVDAEYLISYLWEIGPTLSAGGYPGPITHEELQAWQLNSGVTLQPWETRFLCRLSREYLAESHRAEKRDAKAPWKAEGQNPEVSDTQQALRALANL